MSRKGGNGAGEGDFNRDGVEDDDDSDNDDDRADNCLSGDSIAGMNNIFRPPAHR